MSGASEKALKTRIRSMRSTRQITKAMEMVAASKLHGAQQRAIASRPYFETLYGVMQDLSLRRADLPSPYTQTREGDKVCCIVIAGDRGLAGGYNGNVLKLAYAEMENKASLVLPIGKKAAEFFRSRKIPSLTDRYDEAGAIEVGDCFTIARLLCDEYRSGKFDRLLLAYTNFASVLVQTPAVLPLLPLTRETSNGAATAAVLYEPDSESVFDAIVPEYLGGVLYGALCESVASEQAARRTAMDSATKNADEMIDRLSLQYNRARQGAITQEITEIVAGAES
ncbi:MAG: ATP synthase F1 subunit gamma [Oscillospiraceae bacterium]|nr:ATP synthase F1 subunit gamma [Oscillospiraceae bacterium]